MATKKVEEFTRLTSFDSTTGIYAVTLPDSSPADGFIQFSNFDGFKQSLIFYQDNVTASQTDVILSSLSGTQKTIIMPYSGSILAIGVVSNADWTAGTFSVEVFKQTGTLNASLTNTKSGLAATLDTTNKMRNYTVQAKDIDTFSAGDRIGVMITTNGSWTPVTADILVTVIVEI